MLDAVLQAIQPITELIQTLGFPTAVAIWALWRIDKFFARGDSFQTSLDNLQESVDELHVLVEKNTEIQFELATTLRLLMMTRNLHGGEKDDR